MENSRHKAFDKLRPPCVELSSVALKFRAQQSSVKSVLQALQVLETILVEVASHDILDEKLAEYVFFPLSHVFNESQRLSSRCLEVAVYCLQIVVSHGWRQKLQPDMGKQLLILLSLLAGGSPGRVKEQSPPEELISACYECMTVLFESLGQGAEHPILDEAAAKTIVDRSVYLLLESITENVSEAVQISAVKALRSLLSQLRSRIIVASLMPRTVSALTKALKSTTKTRRTSRMIVSTLELMRYTLSVVLADRLVLDCEPSQAAAESSILDEKWLTATASQVKLALANVIKLRTSERSDIQHAVFDLCLMVCEECSRSLADSLPQAMDTMVTLLNHSDAPLPTPRIEALQHLILSNIDLAHMIRSNLNLWLKSLPRLLEGNDDKPKQQILRQIASSVQLLHASGQMLDLTDGSLANSLVEGVSAVISLEQSKPHTISEPLSSAQIAYSQKDSESSSFEPVIYAHRSQSGSLADLRTLLNQLAGSAIYESLTHRLIARAALSSGNEQLPALWVSLNLLQQNSRVSSTSSVFVELSVELSDMTSSLISDHYSVSLPLLLQRSIPSASTDWRLSALAVESVILQANQLGESYRPELIDTLYPILALLGSPESQLRSHAVTALNLLAKTCGYFDASIMLIENVDYLVNSIALKLNSFDVSPQGPQVLLMMLRLCGARLIPYLDDVIASIFAALDNFHGYPRLVELLFEVLGVLVDEAAKNPPAVMNSMEATEHAKTRSKPSTMEDILEDVRAHKGRMQKREDETSAKWILQHNPRPTPHRPWTSELDGIDGLRQANNDQDPENDGLEDSLPSQVEDEKETPVPKTYSLLLSVARSTIPHLSSPSVPARLALLQLLSRITPNLAKRENSYLPFVNDIWPAILPRLFSIESRKQVNSTEQEAQRDPAYVSAAAADTMAALCRGAGDFMVGRIEHIFPRLDRIYRQIWSEVEAERQRAAQHRRPASTGNNMDNKRTYSSAIEDVGTAGHLRGTVDLRILNSAPPPQPQAPTPPPSSPSSRSTTSTMNVTAIPHQSNHTSRTTTSTTSSPSPSFPSSSLLHASVKSLLTTILTHVHPRDSTADAILSLLSPIMDEDDSVRRALETWNPDAVWVVSEKQNRKAQQSNQQQQEEEEEKKTKVVDDDDGRGQGERKLLMGKNQNQNEKKKKKKPGPVTWWDGTVLEFGDGLP